MKQILNIIRGNSISDIRNSFYYLSRYLKQAESFEKYQKDIFEDTERNIPSELVKSLTFRLIGIIENVANKKAKDFSNDEYLYWMNIIDNIEEDLEPVLDDIQIKKAKEELSRFEQVQKKNNVY